MSYKFKVGDKGKMRCGDDYEIMLVDSAHHHPLVIKRTYAESGRQCYGERRLDGTADGCHSGHDMLPPVEYVWANWCRYDDGLVSCLTYPTEAGARCANSANYAYKVAVKTEVPRP